MAPRDWFNLGLRLLGVWLLIHAIEELGPYIAFVLGNTDWQGFPFMMGWLAGRLVFGLALIFFSPAIANRLYPEAASPKPVRTPEESKLLTVGIQLLAVYALVLAVGPATDILLAMLSSDGTFGLGWNIANVSTSQRFPASLTQFGLHVAFAAVLLMWNDRIVTMITKFRYISERDAYSPPPLK